MKFRGNRSGGFTGNAIAAVLAVFLAAWALVGPPRGEPSERVGSAPPVTAVSAGEPTPPEFAAPAGEALPEAVVDTGKIVDVLSQMRDRVAGSLINTMTGNYIMEQYEKLGLEPAVKEGYAWPYIQNIDGVDMELFNAVGRIPGKDGAKAIVVSSHFDSVATPGAVDNASGVTAMLKVADLLRIGGVEPETDILFACFNGEEQFFLGSTAFVAELVGHYEYIANINLDCVGMVEGGAYLFGCRESEPGYALNTAMRAILDRRGIAYNDSPVSQVNSDHISFHRAGLPNLNFTQQNVYTVIHTERDTADKLDPARIDAVSAAVAELLTGEGK